MPNKKILELTNFSSNGCGVFARVKQEALELSRIGYQVRIFSSDFVKGTSTRLPLTDSIEKVKIIRFKGKKLGGESFLSWDFYNEALKYKPDVIIAHSYRHKHTTLALKIAKKLGCKVFLVTHAPFGRANTRGILGNLAVLFYDAFIGPMSLKKFTKIITITRWEEEYLFDLGVTKDKIEYIPNGIPEEFFTTKKEVKSERRILFLGRVASIKDIETVVKSFQETVDRAIELKITGPISEQNYKDKLDKLIIKENLSSRIKFNPPIYELKDKIKELDSSEFFILPSKSEGMSQSLIEAMARGKIIIASDIIANKELIKENQNGFLFKQGNESQCAKTIDKALSLGENESKTMKMTASKFAEKFSYINITKKIEKLINS